MNMRADYLAKEAHRLLNDDVLAWAMTEVRMNALVALATVDPTDTDEIRRLQAIAGCLEEVRGMLQAAILATGEMDGGMSASEPTV